MPELWGYVVAGYVVTGVALGGYLASLLFRARRAKVRVAAAARRVRDESDRDSIEP